MHVLVAFVLALALEAAGKQPEARVGSIQINGQTGVPAADLRQQLRFLRTRNLLPGTSWKLRPEFTEALLGSEIHRLQSYLIGSGYLDARVQSESVRIDAGNAHITLNVSAGVRYRVRVDGIQTRPGKWARDLCDCLLEERTQAERTGVLDFAARLRIEKTASGPARLTWSTQPGSPYRLRRLEFVGNRTLKDATLRAAMRMDEGDPLDSGLLRSSLRRLSASGLILPMDKESVEFRLDSPNRLADVLIRIKEQKRGRWALSGPIGPMSFAGPLQASLSARLPAWGSGILNLSTYSLSVGVLATAGLPAWGTKAALLPVIALDRPYTPIEGWRSGWTVSPSYAWPLMARTYLSRQASERLMPLIAGRYSLDPPLAVQVARQDGEAWLVCEPAAPRLAGVRRAIPLAVQAVSAIAAF